MILKFLNKNFYINSLICFLIFGFDRISKNYVIAKTNNFSGQKIFTSKYINIDLIWNEGIAFGLLSFNVDKLYNYMSLIIFFVIVIVLIFVIRTKGLDRLFFVMIFSGGAGNFYDRVVYKAVPDFIDLHYNNFHWFIFNIADIFITLGVICLIFSELIFKNGNKKI